MAGLREYKCPCCGGAVQFDSALQKVVCPYCDTEFEMETLAEYDKELSDTGKDDMSWDMDSTATWTEGDAEGMRVYVCKSCGGEIVADENTAAKTCPYCDNPVVIMGSLKGALKPEYIIPFQLDKKAAKEKLKKHFEGKVLLPSVFKSAHHLEEVKGIYVPYWLFDSKAEANMRYKATRIRSWSDSKREYTETSYYSVLRDGELAFSKVPVDGSKKLADDLLESLEPYDSSKAVPFQTGYLAGYLADKYDVDKETCITRANERVRNSTKQVFRSTVQGYSSVDYDGGSIRLNNGKASYAMYPVWILNTKWNGKQYTFAMNGQTGKFVGDLPEDKSITTQIFMKTAVIAAVAAFVVQAILFFI